MTAVNGQQPLTGVVMCCTEIVADRRNALAAIVLEMGATHKYDLTADVTHLVVGAVSTPKYAFVARERPDIRVVLEPWVEAVRDLWMDGQELTAEKLQELEEEHKVPTFWKLNICLTAFEDPNRREEIKTAVESGGGMYHPDLTKTVTHLIAAVASGKKYEYARRWNIKVVVEQWLVDSQRRGMVLDEALYDPLLPLEEVGRGAIKEQLTDEKVSLGKRSREELGGNAQISNKRKLRRTMSAKLGEDSQSLWADINTAPLMAGDSGVGSNVRRRDSASHVESIAEPQAVEPQLSQATARSNMQPLHKTQQDRVMFAGTTIHIRGFSSQKLEILRKHLTLNGASVSTSDSSFESDIHQNDDQILLVPFDVDIQTLPPIAPVIAALPRVTEFWVESCLHNKAIIDPAKDRFCQPFKHLHVNGFEDAIIACTGFVNADLLHFAKTVGLMGAKFDEYLRVETSVLVSNYQQLSSDKVKFALENYIPIVSPSWLFASIDAGEIQPFESHVVVDVEHAQSDRSSRRPRKVDDVQSFVKHERVASRSRDIRNRRKLGGHLSLEITNGRPSSSVATQPRVLQELSHGRLNGPSPSPPKSGSTRKRPYERTIAAEGTEDRQENRDPSESSNPIALQDVDAFDTCADEIASNADLPNSAVCSRQATLAGALKPELNTSIAALLAAKEASLSRRASDSGSLQPSSSRRKRLLGRATSGNSVTSSAMSNADNYCPQGMQAENDESQTYTQRWYKQHANETQIAEEHGRTHSAPPASQGIMYGDEESREKRDELIRKLGGVVERDSSPSKRQAPAVLKDIFPCATSSGLGTRSTRKCKRLQ